MNPLDLKRAPGIVEFIRRLFADAVNQAADAVKDSLIDLSMGDEPDPPGPTVVDLPPLPPQEFVAALRDKVEATLVDLAAVLNEAPAGHVVEASEERVEELLFDLCCE